MYFIKTPILFHSLLPGVLWKGKKKDKSVYLTFDDGPHPEITPGILDILEEYDARATFFCLGEQIDKHPEIYREIIVRGHLTGNHSYSHKDGWLTENEEYFIDVFKCANRVESTLFRPPYGRMKKRQYQYLSGYYNIVMWHIMSGDFDKKVSPQQCVRNVLDNVTDGSIIVFHDNQKAKDTLSIALPEILESLQNSGYQCRSIEEEGVMETAGASDYFSFV